MARQFPDMSVTIRLGDLLDANKKLAQQVREETEAEMLEREREFGCRLVPKESIVKMLGVDPSTLYRWNKAGYLTAVKFGVKVFYKESDIEAIIERHTVKDGE